MTAGDVGRHRFDYVPIGPIRLEAQDPLTARHGFVTGELLAQDDTLVLDVEALGLGRVEGTVLANGIAQPNAHIDCHLAAYTDRWMVGLHETGLAFVRSDGPAIEPQPLVRVAD